MTADDAAPGGSPADAPRPSDGPQPSVTDVPATPAAAGPQALTPLQRLEREPTRFAIDQAAAVLAPGVDPVDIHYRTTARLGSPGGEVTRARTDSAELQTPTFGLIGPGGVLPRHYSALVDAELRQRSTALHSFFDLLARRFTGLFVKAGAKSRPHRDQGQAEQIQAALVGLGTPHLAPALSTPLPAVLYHAGELASRTRSAERLRGMLSEEAGTDVRIVEFAGTWVRLPRSEQSRLAAPGQPGRYVQLGVDLVLGAQHWDPPARFLVQLGPLNLREFEALLPGTAMHQRLVELIRLHVGSDQDFAFNPALHAAAVPALQLGAGPSASTRLGWTSWLTSPHTRQRPARQAILQPQSP